MKKRIISTQKKKAELLEHVAEFIECLPAADEEINSFGEFLMGEYNISKSVSDWFTDGIRAINEGIDIVR